MEQSEFESMLASAQLHTITQLFHDNTLSKEQFQALSSKYLAWFCSQHDPRLAAQRPQHPDNTHGGHNAHNYDLINALNDSEVWSAFYTHEAGRCPTQPQHFAALLRIYCQLDGYLSEDKLNPSLLVPFVEHMLQYAASTGLGQMDSTASDLSSTIAMVDDLANALAVLALTKLFKRAALFVQVIPLLVLLLERNLSRESCTVMNLRLCKALNNMCHHSIPNKLAFIESGGVALLMESILVGTLNVQEKLKETAALLLRCICNTEERRDSLLSATRQQLLPNLLELIEYYREGEHRALQQHLVWALVNATRNRDDLKEQFGKLNGFSNIIAVMSQYQKVESFQSSCSILILQMCTKRMNKKQFGKAGGVPVLMAVFDHFAATRDSDEVIEMALEALHRLCDHAVNRKRLLAHGVKPLLDLFTKSSRKRDIVLLLLKIFSLIANGAGSSRLRLREANLSTYLFSLKLLFQSDAIISLEIATLQSDLVKEAGDDSEDSDEDSNSYDDDSDEYFENFDSKKAFSLTEGLSILKNSLAGSGGDETVDSLRQSIQERAFTIAQLKRELSRASEDTEEQERQIQSLQKGLKSNQDLVNERAHLEAHNRQLMRELNHANELLSDQIMQSNTRKESLSRIESQISEKRHAMEASRNKHKTEMAALLAEYQELDLQEDRNKKTLQSLNEATEPQQKKMAASNDLIDQMRHMIFHWMSVSLKLNYAALNGSEHVAHYDAPRLYQQIIEQKCPYQSWPAMIAKQLEAADKERI